MANQVDKQLGFDCQQSRKSEGHPKRIGAGGIQEVGWDGG